MLYCARILISRVAFALFCDAGNDGPSLESTLRSRRSQARYHDGAFRPFSLHVQLRLIQDLLGSGDEVTITSLVL